MAEAVVTEGFGGVSASGKPDPKRVRMDDVVYPHDPESRNEQGYGHVPRCG